MEIFSKHEISLRTVLNMTVGLSATVAFFMGYELIGRFYSISFLVLMMAAFLIELRGFGHPPRIVINLATSATLLIIFTRVRRNYIVEALMEALLLMTAVKMLEDKRSRDYVQIVALGLATVVTYAMLSVEKTFIIYCFGMALTSTMILLLSTWFDKDESAVMTLGELRQLFVRTGAIFCLMSPLCLLLFFGLPRTASPIFGMQGAYGSTVTGFSDQVRLGDASSIQTSNKLAFRAEMEKLTTPYPYWRGVVLDIFDGSLWISSRISSRNSIGRGPFVPEPNAPRIEQDIYLEPGNRGYLFALDQPISVTGMDYVVSDGDGSFRYRGSGVGRRLQYRAVSVPSARMKPLSPQVNRRRYLSLPDNFIPALSALVADTIRGNDDDEKITAIMAFLSSSEFTYSLDELSPGRNALETFIFDSKKGNCEYFASAMGVMLRMSGIPARLVAGYRGGVYNDTGGYYIVQEQNAHIWVEAWDEASGEWVRHDPTPVGGAGGGEAEYNAFSLYLDYLDYQWSKLVVNYSLETQLDIVQNLREIINNPQAPLITTLDGLRRFGDALSGPALIIVALVVCAALFYAARSIRNHRPEMALLHKFLRAMRRNGYHKHKSEGLTEFLGRVDDAPLRASALPFVRGFEELYFKDAVIDAESCKRLQKHIDAIARKRA